MNLFEWLKTGYWFGMPDEVSADLQRIRQACVFGTIQIERSWLGVTQYKISIVTRKMGLPVFTGTSHEEVVFKLMRYMGAA